MNNSQTLQLVLWHPSLTSDLPLDRSTWTWRCPSSSTHPPVRTPTAPAPQETTRSSPTTRCLTSPVFPNSSPVTGWLGHKTWAGGVCVWVGVVGLKHLCVTHTAWETKSLHAILPQCFSSSTRLKLKTPLRATFLPPPQQTPQNSEGLFCCLCSSFLKWNYIFVLGPVFLLRTICGVKPFRAYWDSNLRTLT